jgi:hypothetical protein
VTTRGCVIANVEMQREFVANGGEKPKREKVRRRKPMPTITDSQARKKNIWKQIRRAFLLAQERTNGYLSCMQCGLVVDGPEHLDLDHIIHAGRGGLWVADNAELLCNWRSRNGAKSCHSQKHGEPQWSNA